LDLLEIRNLGFFIDCSKAPTIEGNLFLFLLSTSRKLNERSLDKTSKGGGRRDFSGCSLLVAEETAFTATRVWK
jgi:hypothetical protein